MVKKVADINTLAAIKRDSKANLSSGSSLSEREGSILNPLSYNQMVILGDLSGFRQRFCFLISCSSYLIRFFLAQNSV